MAPKKKAVKELGSLTRKGECGWRAEGLNEKAPTRATDAWRDLSYARSAASREEFKDRLQALRQDNLEQSAPPVPSDSVAPGLCHDATGITAASLSSHALASPSKRMRTKSPATAAPGLCHTAAGSRSSELAVVSAAPGLCHAAHPSRSSSSNNILSDGASGLCPSAFGSSSVPDMTMAMENFGQPVSLAQQVTLRGLNIQFPFSQLVLLGAKTIEARTYRLGKGNIAQAGEEMFLIETPGKGMKGALVGDWPVGDPPAKAQVVGTVTFRSSTPYQTTAAWKKDRSQHLIREGASHDWSGDGEMHGWTVGAVRRFARPVPAGSKSMTGFGTPRTLDVILEDTSS